MQNILSLNNFNLSYAGYDLILSENDYNPLNLPAYTIRLLFDDNIVPVFDKGIGVQISVSPNIWDLTYANNNWNKLLKFKMLNPQDHNQLNRLVEVLGANTTGVTDMSELFNNCIELTNVALFDTSSVTKMDYMFSSTNIWNIPHFNTKNVTSMSYMFYNCEHLGWNAEIPLLDTSNVTNMDGIFLQCKALTYIPLFNTSKVINADYMFYDCFHVKGNALRMYQQMSMQSQVPQTHVETFYRAGDRQYGGNWKELSLIPASWGGYQ